MEEELLDVASSPRSAEVGRWKATQLMTWIKKRKKEGTKINIQVKLDFPNRRIKRPAIPETQRGGK